VIGKNVKFETLKQGASAGDRVYGWLFVKPTPDATPVHLALELVKQGWATPKPPKAADVAIAEAGGELSPEQQYEQDLQTAFRDAVNNKRGIHATDPLPLVRTVKQAVEDFPTVELVNAFKKHGENGQLKCIIEHVFDGSRLRCQVTDDAAPGFQYANFTLLLAGITAPRVGNPKADPPVPPEPLCQEARQFTLLRVLQRELKISLVGTDKSGTCAVGTVHHPAGNIAVELLKVGLARVTDWSTRLMSPAEVPPLRIAENAAKRASLGVWTNYEQPQLESAAQIVGNVVEVSSGDTLFILPKNTLYSSDNDLVRVSLASVRAPRLGNERAGRSDEPYAYEAKERLRVLTIGKEVNVTVHYEREIPLKPDVNEKRPFGTVSVGSKYPDVAEVLMKEGLAVTQHHRDEDPRSPRYDDLRAAEDTAKSEGKGLHGKKEYKPPTVNDLTDPRKAKAYSGSLIRAKSVKAIVDYVFNGALFKLYIPSENCFIRFAPANIRCPQPSPPPGAKSGASSSGRPAEPFGDEAKCYSKFNLLQRSVEIDCQNVTNSGIVTGSLYTGFGPQRKDYAVELVGAGLCTLDQRRVDFGEVPSYLMDAQTAAQNNKAGIWSVAQPQTEAATSTASSTTTKRGLSEVKTTTIRLSEIRSGNHFFFQVVGDTASSTVEEGMKEFTSKYGTDTGSPCDVKINKVVAALFDDGTGKAWYRAKIVERKGPGRVAVLFIDHGNVATVSVATHLRPLDDALGVDKIAPVATEASLAFVTTRSLSTDEGMEAARMLQSLCWGHDLKAQLLAPDESGKLAVILFQPTTDSSESSTTVNSELISAGLARAPKPYSVKQLQTKLSDPNVAVKLAADLQVDQETAHRSRVGMWRYGDPGDSDEEDA
jgi:staphylococcal nuclease domain-containing protein 1